MSTLQQKCMCVGCDTEFKRSVDRKKLVSDEVEANAFTRCLKRRIAVDDILCNKCQLPIYRNNSDKDSDYTGLQGFVVEKLWVVSGVIFDVESGIRISLSRQDFEIFEVMCSKYGGFRYF